LAADFSGSATTATLSGTAATETLGGSAGTVANNLGGTAVQPVIYSGSAAIPVLSGTADTVANILGASVSQNDLGGTLAEAYTFGGGLIGWSMEQINQTFGEFNDITLNATITSSGSPLNLTGYTVNMLLKTAAGVPDDDETVIVLSSTGGSPAITIVSASAGTIQVDIANADVQNQDLAFYRIDAVNTDSQKNTAIYGNITYIAL
jgi:hypothetical protein